MIGDWVLSLFNTPIKIDPYKWVLDEQKKGNEVIGFRFNDLSPIPLTEEILKANGFEVVNLSNLHKCYFRQKDNEDGTELYNIEVEYYSDNPDACFIDVTYDSIGSVRLKCKYVHEFQHALRLCGLNELADNFKVGGTE